MSLLSCHLQCSFFPFACTGLWLIRDFPRDWQAQPWRWRWPRCPHVWGNSCLCNSEASTTCARLIPCWAQDGDRAVLEAAFSAVTHFFQRSISLGGFLQGELGGLIFSDTIFNPGPHPILCDWCFSCLFSWDQTSDLGEPIFECQAYLL